MMTLSERIQLARTVLTDVSAAVFETLRPPARAACKPVAGRDPRKVQALMASKVSDLSSEAHNSNDWSAASRASRPQIGRFSVTG